MPIRLHIKSGDPAVKQQRETTAHRVIDYFGDRLPSTRLLCFLDDEDPSTLRADRGPANRGFSGPIHAIAQLDGWPSYVRDCVYPSDRTGYRTRVIDDLVYLFGSTCANDVGLTMTLAHELQHVVQHANVRYLWAANSLVNELNREIFATLKLTWADIPIEREARIVAKRAAVHLFDERRVREYIEGRIHEHVSDSDSADWQFILSLTPTDSYDLLDGTRKLFQQLKGHRPEIADALQTMRERNPDDFEGVDLDPYFTVPTNTIG
jgi:hypothetical protein